MSIRRFAPSLIVILIMISSSAHSTTLSYNFGEQACGACDWFVVVDGVMGGRSTGELSVKSNSLLLSGTISLENRGGFSSIRTPFSDIDLSSFSQVTVRYRSTGQSFAFTLANHRRFYRPNFKATLPESNGEWAEITLKFEDFKKVRFGDVLGGGPTTKELSKVIRLGLISSDKVAGAFSLEIDYIEFE